MALVENLLVTLRVQSTQIWGIYGFSIGDRNYSLGYILHVWVLGPIGSSTEPDKEERDSAQIQRVGCPQEVA